LRLERLFLPPLVLHTLLKLLQLLLQQADFLRCILVRESWSARNKKAPDNGAFE
jgi:hypothetical protein